MLSRNLHKAVETEVRTKVLYHLISKYNTLHLTYMNDSNMTDGHYKAQRKVISEMIKSYKCYPDVKHIVEEFEECNP